MRQGTQAGNWIRLGRIAGPHGVKGWIKVLSDTEPKEAILEYSPWLLGETGRAAELLEGARHGKAVIARLEGVADRDQAAALEGLEIRVDRDQLPDPEEHQYYWADLIGLNVVLEDGESLGTVREMMATGANDVMVVEGARQRLIPFVRGRTVLDVNLESGEVRVSWDKDF